MPDADYTSVIRFLTTWIILSGLFLGYRTQVRLISKKQLQGIFSRLILSWLALFFFYTYYHFSITKNLLPVFAFLLNTIQSDFLATLSILDDSSEAIKIDIKILNMPFLESGVELIQYFYVPNILQQLAFFPAILIAWPVKQFQGRLILFILGIILPIALLMLILPFLMAFQCESIFTVLAKVNNIVRPAPYYQWWIRFMVNDGHFIVMIFMIIFATKAQQKIIHLHQEK